MTIDIAIPILLLVGLMLSGLPVAFSLGISGLVGCWMVTGDIDLASAFLGLVPLAAARESSILALPLFLLMAYVSSRSRLADDLYRAATAWLSGLRGGLAFATVVAGGAMGAMSGTTTAAASALSGITVRNQIRAGYSREMSSATAAVSATSALLIPPSILMVIYGTQTQTSVGDLLIAGIIPGILLAFLVAVTLRVWIAVRPDSAPEPSPTPWGERLRLTLAIWPSLLIMVAVFAALYGGFMTPTEVAGLGALLTLAVALGLRRLDVASLMKASMQTVQATSMILMILIGGMIFARYLSLTRLPQELAGNVVDADLNRWLVIALIIIGYFVMSMFMDELPLVILTLPITFPIITELGFDGVWFGVITCFMVIMGLIFPPVGMIVFIVSATTGVRSSTIFKGTAVLLVPVILTTILVVVFPDLALWLPSLN